MTAQEVFEIAMDLMDEREDDGSLDAQSTANYKAKAPRILTKYQNELLMAGEYFKTLEISNTNIQPVISQFDTINHNTDDIIFETITPNTKFLAYSFECNSEATVYIEELVGGVWNVLNTINVPNIVTTYQRYFGLVTPSNPTSMRIRFSGSFYYNARNIACFKESFNSVDKIPAQEGVNRYEMPSDFNSQKDIISEEVKGDYIKSANYQWEGKKTLILPNDFQGTIKIVYRPIPPDITDLSQDLVIDDRTAKTALVDALVTELMLADENPNASYYNGKFNDNLQEALKPRKPQYTDIFDGVDTSLDASW